MRTKTTYIFVIAICFLALLSGCFSSNPKNIKAFVKPAMAPVSAEDYILRPPDQIEIHCSKVPELDLQIQQIRPDGKVSFQAIGEIDAAGKTPRQLASDIYKKAVTLYSLVGENPIDVRVVVYQGNVYYVMGQVYYPGAKPLTGHDTVFKALSNARPTVLAWKERIQVIRPSSDPKKLPPKIFEINLDQMEAHGDLSKNVLLQEGDIVYVPPTILAAIAMKIEEAIRPVARAFSAGSIAPN